MNNIAVSQNVFPELPASESHSEVVEKPDSHVSLQLTQSNFEEGKARNSIF